MKTKTVIASILASGLGTQAIAGTLSVSRSDLQLYESVDGRAGFSQKLFMNGVLLPTKDAEFFVLNAGEASALQDEETIAIASDLINWLSQGKSKWETRRWQDMTLASQDIHGAE